MKNRRGRNLKRKDRRDKRSLLETDTSERFVLRTCLLYMERLLNQMQTFETDTLIILIWLLGNRVDQIAEQIASNLRGPRRAEFLDEFMDAEDDANEYAVIIHKGGKRLSRASQKELWNLIIRQLQKKRRELGYRGTSQIEKNIKRFQEVFLLTEQEREFVVFLYIVSTYGHAEDYFVDHLGCQKLSNRKYLATALGFTQKEMDRIMKGTLAQIEAYIPNRYSMDLEDDYLNFLFNPSPDALSKYYFTPDTSAGVPLEDHFLDKEQLDYLIRLLRRKSDQPVNILFYGAGGTGKTTLAYCLSNALGVRLFEIVRNEENESKARRAALHACLNMTANHKDSVILVDEADNVLNTRFSFFMRGETQDKGWLNQVLERKGARIIWITNDIANIEEPVRRRFSYSLHFKPFNKRQRMRLWENILQRNKVKRFVPSSEISTLAKTYQVSAGAIDMAVKKAVQVGAGSKTAFIRAITLNLDSHEVLINDGERPRRKDRVEENYTLDGLNIAGDVNAILDQAATFSEYLNRTQTRDKKVNMNLLFHGPPGTGKSELARYIADHVDREIITRRASDILDPFIGMTERRIREAFEEAEREEAVLVIDEVDSMLFSRESARRSWEISFTNEFLTQLESYRGILICTTNRLKGLDSASLRRFNHKIGFDYLEAAGKVVFYDLFLSPLVGSPMPHIIKRRLEKVPRLTPGDFKVVRDKARFIKVGQDTHENMLEALSAESEVKPENATNNKVGF